MASENPCLYSAGMAGYTVKEIADILGISRNHAYDYINDMGFRIIRIGAAIRIPKTEFDKWFDGSD